MLRENYDIEDFLQDDSFCDFCLGKGEAARASWEGWLEANPEKKSLVASAKELYVALNGGHTAEEFRSNQAIFLERLGLGIVSGAERTGDDPVMRVETPEAQFGTPEAQARVFRLKRWAPAAAAVLFLAAVGTWWMSRSGQTVSSPVAGTTQMATGGTVSYSTVEGGKKAVHLADGSEVVLNSGSIIELAAGFGNKSREVSLSGEGYFSVAANPNLPFIVHTRAMDVRVLGTVVNIRAYPEDKTAEATLVTGMVQVTGKGKDSTHTILHPNQKLILSNLLKASLDGVVAGESLVRQTSQLSNIGDGADGKKAAEIQWTTEDLNFRDDRLEEIAARLERRYHVKIIFTDAGMKDWKYTGTFVDKSLEEVLGSLQLSNPFHYANEGTDTIVVKK